MDLIDRVKTRFEYLWRDETEMKSKEPGGEPVQLPYGSAFHGLDLISRGGNLKSPWEGVGA
jgi:hypothetical protein